MRLVRLFALTLMIFLVLNVFSGVFAAKTGLPVMVISPAGAQIRITAPAEGARWQYGASQTIAWTANVRNHTGQITLVSNGDTVQTIAGNVPLDSQQYTWKVPGNLNWGSYSTYQIKITDNASNNANGLSGQFFLLSDVTANLKIVEPQAGSTFDCKSLAQIPIKWTYTGNPGETVQIGLVGDDNKCGTVAEALIGANGQGVFYVQLISLRRFVDLLTAEFHCKLRITMKGGVYVEVPDITLTYY
jgi:hypothetical protein